MAIHASNENHYIQLRIRYTRCYEETGIDWTGADEMAVGGVAIYHDFRTKSFYKKIGEFNTGTKKKKNFKLVAMSMWGGDKKEIGTPLHTIKPFHHNPADSDIPKYYGAVVFMAESDYGNFKNWIHTELRDEVQDIANYVKQRIILNVATSGSLPNSTFIRNAFEESYGTLKVKFETEMLISKLNPFGDAMFIPSTPFIYTHTNSYVEFPESIRGDANNNTENKTRHFKHSEIGKNAHYELDLDWKMYK
jgi:hypothetical protein